MNGHWPVKKASDLAQPSPMDRDSDPSLAGSSTAPGSPVTYKPGMPIRPAARVMSIIVLSTVACRSVAASSPWPRASNPTASTAASTSGTPRICSIWSRGVPFGDVDGFAAEGCGLGQAVRVQVADDHHRGTEQLRRGRGGQPDRSRAGDVDGGTGAHSGGDAAVEPGRGKMSDNMVRSRIFSSAWSLSGTSAGSSPRTAPARTRPDRRPSRPCRRSRRLTRADPG
jgi:hypothetical protein